MAWDKNELIPLSLIVLSVSVLTLSGRVSESNYMLVLTGVTTYTFGRIFNHTQGKE
jgi:hypothetical protein